MTFFGIEIDFVYIISQLVGFLAMGIGIISFQSRTRSRILAMQIASNLLWMAQYFLIGSFSAVVANLLGTVRNIIYSFRGKYKFADSKLLPAVMIVLFIISGVFTYEEPIDILPTIAMVFASVAFFVKNENMIRYLSLFVSIGWFSFAVLSGSISGAISDGLAFVSIVVAIVRYHIFNAYGKNAGAHASDAHVAKEDESDRKVDEV